ncbi:glycosyltransferase [Ferruginibacter yonginensis]|uniref:Glycosyltransferase n=1 Tax=Ferruginibacter yonginensis TaxID=1310416 RepID=A0ABV8QR64_9BACT
MQQKKVLIVGPIFHGYNESVEQAFKNLNFQTKVIGFTDGAVENVKEKVQFYLTKTDDFYKFKNKQFNSLFEKTYNEFKPDILFIIKGHQIDPTVISKMKSSANILWMMDSIHSYPGSLAILPYVHKVFLFEATDIPLLKEKYDVDGTFMPLALDEKVYFPITNKKEIDILFVGGLVPDRIRLLDKIIEKFPDKKISIYGQYYSKFRRPLHHLFRKNKKNYTNKIVLPSKLNELYSKSKLCINIHQKQSVIGVNQRFFEILGSKNLQICDHKKFISDNFLKDDLLWYHNEQELFDTISFALNNYNDLNNVITNGYEKVTSKHTFTHRIKQILTLSEVL